MISFIGKGRDGEGNLNKEQAAKLFQNMEVEKAISRKMKKVWDDRLNNLGMELEAKSTSKLILQDE